LTKKKEDLNGWLRLYNAYKILNESKKAVNALKTAIKISPDNIKLKLILLKELLPASTKPNFTKEIESLITDILLLNPNNIDALFFKGLLALKNGNKINAIKIWQFLIEKLPKNSVMKLEILKKLNEIKK
jgi:cytochrome c-type biogenesis protein CcmH/NrfG